MAFKKGHIGEREYYEDVLKPSFSDKLPEMLPKILKALPPERASALKAVMREKVCTVAKPSSRRRVNLGATS